jgi:hypothetical protein
MLLYFVSFSFCCCFLLLKIERTVKNNRVYRRFFRVLCLAIHPTLPIDRKQCSHKFNHAAIKYEIALSVFEPKCVWISGPHWGAKHDITIFREGFKDKVKDGKKIIVDRGYTSNKPDERILSQPSALDSKELSNFKSWARLRQETFNGRLKYFNALAQTFLHTKPQHGLVLEAVRVIVQYQMDNGRPIFDV